VKLSEILHQYGSPLYVEIGPLIFVWSGGAYIDIFARDANDGVVVTDECINVFDYMNDTVTIPFTTTALIDQANQWIKDRM